MTADSEPSETRPRPAESKAWQVRQLVVATDFSDPASRALDYAMVIAKQFEAHLELVHVFNVPLQVPLEGSGPALSTGTPAIPTPNTSLLFEQRKALEQKLEQLAAECNARGVPTSHRLLQEEKAERAIVDAAQDAEADLIVLGTHGRTGLERLLLGSVAEGVLRRTTLPVLVVPAKSKG